MELILFCDEHKNHTIFDVNSKLIIVITIPIITSDRIETEK